MKRWAEELRAVAAAYAAVLFCGDARLGALLIALTLLQPASGAMGLLCVVSAHATAALLGYRRDLRAAGAHGYNAALLGLLLAAGHGFDGTVATLSVVGGALSVPLTVVLGDRLQHAGGLPVLVLPFVLLGWLLSPMVADATPGFASWLPALQLPWPFDDAANGLAAVYCLHGAWAGILVFGLLLLHSRLAALAALVGIAAAMAMGRCLGLLPGTALAIALVYNGAFTGIALGAALLVPGRAALAVAALGAAAAALLCIGLTAPLQRLQLPLLSLPFALVVLVALRALQLRLCARPPFVPPLPSASPEANYEFVHNMAHRFGPPSVPEFGLPLGRPASGEWIVSQGVAGEHTHHGPWEHAWDFEVVDARGFPFVGAGDQREHYFAFGAPVVAPAAGTVAMVQDGVPDGAVGAVDSKRPWGNVVVLQHGPALFSVLAHLRCGSVRVQKGQAVALGEALASCGSSGRSPRPHLHFQVQNVVEPGAPSLPARCVHYLVHGQDGVRYVAFGSPAEGERIAASPPAKANGLFAALTPGAQMAFSLAPGDGQLRLVSEISLLGERWLRDVDRGDRLYFVLGAHEVVFTTHAGPNDAPLRGWLLALPRLPWLDAPAWSWRDAPPAAAILPPLLRVLRALLRPFADPFATRAELRARWLADRLVVDSCCGHGHSTACCQGHVELDASGVVLLELTRTGAPGPQLVLRRSQPAALLPTSHPGPVPYPIQS